MSDHIQSNQSDQQQITSLCSDLGVRLETLRVEELLLADLVGMTAPTRPHQSREYRRLLDGARERYRQLHAVIQRFCQGL
jgi:hypothetical protein